ncbi:prepilin-type N-terminal cleavage/methylation domain-containing protein [Shewanella sp. 202IG2-18]|nr:prepilin-type N-terminal cleavage/methylation domain-containing protein [Parashewanella hymeniacidonis]
MNKNGFTLIELIAVIVLTGALFNLPVLSLYSKRHIKNISEVIYNQ